MNTFAIAVVGRDRPGIVAEVTGALADHDGNIEDSSMTLLRGHFAWMLVVSLPIDAEDLDASLAQICSDELRVDVMALPTGHAVKTEPTHLLSVHGGDRPGIVAAVTRAIADVGGNVTDLSTRLTDMLYVVVAEVTLPSDIELGAFQRRLDEVGQSVGVEISLRELEIEDGY